MPISPQEILSGGLLTAGQWATVSAAALELFRFGQEEAAKRGLILVDTKVGCLGRERHFMLPL